MRNACWKMARRTPIRPRAPSSPAPASRKSSSRTANISICRLTAHLPTPFKSSASPLPMPRMAASAIRFKVSVQLPTQGGIFSQANAIALQSNGDVVAVGRMEVQAGNRTFNTSFGVARVLSSGAVDTKFGTDGSVVTGFPSNQADATAVTVQQDGNILVGGTGGGGMLAVARYLAK